MASYSYCIISTGVFMASQARIIACGTKKAILAMALKFVLGPVLMAISSITVGLRGKLFRLAIVQVKLQCFLLSIHGRSLNAVLSTAGSPSPRDRSFCVCQGV